MLQLQHTGEVIYPMAVPLIWMASIVRQDMVRLLIMIGLDQEHIVREKVREECDMTTHFHVFTHASHVTKFSMREFKMKTEKCTRGNLYGLGTRLVIHLPNWRSPGDFKKFRSAICKLYYYTEAVVKIWVTVMLRITVGHLAPAVSKTTSFGLISINKQSLLRHALEAAKVQSVWRLCKAALTSRNSGASALVSFSQIQAKRSHNFFRSLLVLTIDFLSTVCLNWHKVCTKLTSVGKNVEFTSLCHVPSILLFLTFSLNMRSWLDMH